MINALRQVESIEKRNEAEFTPRNWYFQLLLSIDRYYLFYLRWRRANFTVVDDLAN